MIIGEYTGYSIDSGQILQTGDTPTEIPASVLQEDRMQIVAGHYDSEQYYFDLSAGEMRLRADMLMTSPTTVIADGISEAVISGVPDGVWFTWPDGEWALSDGSDIHFSVDLVGTYTFRFFPVEYKNREVTIEAVPAT